MSASRRSALLLGVALVLGACQSGSDIVPTCGRGNEAALVLVAQSVPSATLLPCVDVLAAGWRTAGGSIVDGRTQFWLESDLAGFRSVEVELAAECDTSRAIEVVPSPDEAGARVFQEPTSLDPFRGKRYLTFEGGCATYTYSFRPGAPIQLSLEAEEALSFAPRDQAVTFARDELDQTLCGAGAPPCDG